MPPAAGFNTWAGTSGRIKAGLVTPDLTVDLVTSAAKAAVTPATQTWVREWKATERVQSGRLGTLESPTTAQGVVRAQALRGGIGEVSVDIRGVIDGNSGGDYNSRFPIGGFIVVDLLFSKSSDYGRQGVMLKIVGTDEGVLFRADPDEFIINCELADGVWPDPSYGV